MALSRLGDYIEQIDIRNSEYFYSEDDVMGISVNKVLIPTKADLSTTNLKGYKVLKEGQFAYCLVTSRNGNKISIVFNDLKDCIISPINPVFEVKDENLLDPYYLMMFFKRAEFDRYARFNSWGSAREVFSWEDFCDTMIPLPPIEIQRKYVSIYKAMKNNLRLYQNNLEDLKLVLDMNLDDIKHNCTYKKISSFASEKVRKNNELKVRNMKGVGIHGFIPPNQSRTEESLKKCSIFNKGDFVYAPSSLKNGVIEYNFEYDEAICTEEYIVFNINQNANINPYYLLMWLKRSEFGRYIDFISIDSVRNRFYFESLGEQEIPIPTIEVQNSLGCIYQAYILRKKIVNSLTEQINNLCPILITGAIKESEELA